MVWFEGLTVGSSLCLFLKFFTSSFFVAKKSVPLILEKSEIYEPEK